MTEKEARKQFDEAVNAFILRDKRIAELEKAHEEYEELLKGHDNFKEAVFEALLNLADAVN